MWFWIRMVQSCSSTHNDHSWIQLVGLITSRCGKTRLGSGLRLRRGKTPLGQFDTPCNRRGKGEVPEGPGSRIARCRKYKRASTTTPINNPLQQGCMAYQVGFLTNHHARSTNTNCAVVYCVWYCVDSEWRWYLYTICTVNDVGSVGCPEHPVSHPQSVAELMTFFWPT
jgi:hypothetical protein